jgi:hypothetical protein
MWIGRKGGISSRNERPVPLTMPVSRLDVVRSAPRTGAHPNMQTFPSATTILIPLPTHLFIKQAAWLNWQSI